MAIIKGKNPNDLIENEYKSLSDEAIDLFGKGQKLSPEKQARYDMVKDQMEQNAMPKKWTQRGLAVQYGDYLKEHPENIKWGAPNEYGDQDLEWDNGEGFLKHIGYRGTKDDWHKAGGPGLYFGYVGGIERNNPERIQYLKEHGKDWYWSLGYDDVDDLISDDDMERIERYYADGNKRDLDALREKRAKRYKVDPAVQKLKDAGWSDERIAAAEEGIKEKHPEKLIGSKSRFAQKYPDRYERLKGYNVYGKGRTAEDVDWDEIASILGVDLG